MIRLTLAVTAALLLLAGLLAYGPSALIDEDDAQPDLVTRAPAEPQAPADGLTQTVLASLSASTLQPGDAPEPRGGPVDMDALTRSVVTSLAAAGGAQPAAGQAEGLADLIVKAMAHSDSDAYLDALLNEAAVAGTFAVPAGLRTAEGRVDTRTLLNDIVARAVAETDPTTTRRIAPQSDAAPAARPERPAVAETYTVQRGDSLGAIAQRFYGDAGYYREIYEANRGVLRSPDRIAVGQELRLPRIGA